jgi:dTDP-glucose 4,6-dehydratase
VTRSLVTGAAGFLGSHLSERLLAEGHEVIGVDNFLTGRRANMASFEDDPRFEFVEQDVCEPIAVDGDLDYVLHFASPASPMDYQKHAIATLRVGAHGTENTLELARAKGARFLLASTSEVYGDPQEHPQKETYWGRVNPIGERSMYDEAKRFAEAMAMAYEREHDLDVRIVRIFNTYGPRMKLGDGRVVPAFMEQALEGKPLTVFGGGTQTRSFCFVDDLVDGIVRLLYSDATGPVNIGNPEELKIREFADRILAVTGSSSPIVERPLPQDDPLQRRPDIGRARAELGWEPKVDLATGLARTVDYFRHEVAARRGATEAKAPRESVGR